MIALNFTSKQSLSNKIEKMYQERKELRERMLQGETTQENYFQLESLDSDISEAETDFAEIFGMTYSLYTGYENINEQARKEMNKVLWMGIFLGLIVGATITYLLMLKPYGN